MRSPWLRLWRPVRGTRGKYLVRTRGGRGVPFLPVAFALMRREPWCIVSVLGVWLQALLLWFTR